MKHCTRKRCPRPANHVSGYCSDTCLQADHDVDLPPVTVLAPNKQDGFGVSLYWAIPVPVKVPPVLPGGYK